MFFKYKFCQEYLWDYIAKFLIFARRKPVFILPLFFLMEKKGR